MPFSTSSVSSPGFMNLRCTLPAWKTQIQQHVERLISGSVCLAKAHPYHISDWLVDLLLVWLSESCTSVRSRELYFRSLGKPPFFFFPPAITPVRRRSGMAPKCNQPCWIQCVKFATVWLRFILHALEGDCISVGKLIKVHELKIYCIQPIIPLLSLSPAVCC